MVLIVNSDSISSSLKCIELLVKAVGYCSDEKEIDSIMHIISEKTKPLLKVDDPRVKYMQANLPNFGNIEPHKSPEESEALYNQLMEESAEGGVAEAEYQHACRLYESGKLNEAVALYQNSADKGYPPSQYCYGLAMFNGVGISKDTEEGLKYIKLSAGRLDDYALEFLVNLYDEGNSQGDIQSHNHYLKLLSWAESQI